MEDYKEKYEMALEKAKTLLSKCKRVSDKASMIYRAEDIESMFPELKEVDDEQIRKWLISQLKIKSDVNNSRELELMILKSIDWLEKQGKETISQFENNDSLINKNDALKNAIIRFFEDRYPKAMEIYDGNFTATIGQVLSWLEKQSDQSSNIL